MSSIAQSNTGHLRTFLNLKKRLANKLFKQISDMVKSSYGCMRWLIWFRHYATNRKVTDSIPDMVTTFINLTNPCIRTMAVGSTNPLTAINTSYLRVVKGNADSLVACIGSRF
jgi:hypothetical protein